MRLISWIILPLALLASGAGPANDPVPTVTLRSVRQLPRPLPTPYDAARDARADVAAARKRARRTHKLLLIDFGANWCADCRVLAGVLDLPELRGWATRHFEIVQVDVGEFDANLDIAPRYGLARLRAIPAVLVVDPKSGKLLNKGEELALGDARIMRPQAIADWLGKWTR